MSNKKRFITLAADRRHISGSSLLGRLLALVANIRPGWKDVPPKNALAYFAPRSLPNKKSFITLATDRRHISGSSLLGKLLALVENIRPGWKGLPYTNALAYFAPRSMSNKKVFKD
jgi:hypothetical protein